MTQESRDFAATRDQLTEHISATGVGYGLLGYSATEHYNDELRCGQSGHSEKCQDRACLCRCHSK